MASGSASSKNVRLRSRWYGSTVMPRNFPRNRASALVERRDFLGVDVEIDEVFA
jgi:hypothetical protein